MDLTNLSAIQKLYDDLCLKHDILSVKVYFVSSDEDSCLLANRPLDYKGLYVHWPFRKIFLNTTCFDDRTVYHEFLHHLYPSIPDGPEFESLLDRFITYQTKEGCVVSEIEEMLQVRGIEILNLRSEPNKDRVSVYFETTKYEVSIHVSSSLKNCVCYTTEKTRLPKKHVAHHFFNAKLLL